MAHKWSFSATQGSRPEPPYRIGLPRPAGFETPLALAGAEVLRSQQRQLRRAAGLLLRTQPVAIPFLSARLDPTSFAVHDPESPPLPPGSSPAKASAASQSSADARSIPKRELAGNSGPIDLSPHLDPDLNLDPIPDPIPGLSPDPIPDLSSDVASEEEDAAVPPPRRRAETSMVGALPQRPVKATAVSMPHFDLQELQAQSPQDVPPPPEMGSASSSSLRSSLPTLSPDDPSGSPPPSEGRIEGHRVRLLAGRMIPGTRYRIVRWLGEGGMGVVYEVENVDIEKRFALKILRAGLSQQSHIAKVFRDEARAASRIGSPYIIDISHFGELSDGRLYFCMEMLEGRDLAPESTESWIEVPVLIGYLRQICKGLGAAHEQGIVHRDIKPENILVVPRDGREYIKLVDFGISAMVFGQKHEASGGTPHYMAPEQILGLEFDGRLDMYALGCTAYELLIGLPPFDDEDVQALFRKQIEDAPPTFAEIRSDRQIPPAVEKVIRRCLEKDPNDRYANMDELEAALCEAQVEAGISTPWDDLPLPNVDPDRRAALVELMPGPTEFRVRRRWLWPSIAVLTTCIALGLFFLLQQREATPKELDAIEGLVARAQNAGARTWYVYPPDHDPKAETSYLVVLALENLEGPLDYLGDAAAKRLRKQFANTLSSVGDRYWSVEGARIFAQDFYTQAIFFDPQHSIAKNRAGISTPQLNALRHQAQSRSFSPEVLASVQIINDLADPDQERREAKLRSRQHSKKQSAIARGMTDKALSASKSVKSVPSVPKLSNHHSVLSKEQISRLAPKIPKVKNTFPATPNIPKIPKANPETPNIGQETPTPRAAETETNAPNRRRPKSRKDRKESKNRVPESSKESKAAKPSLVDIQKSTGYLEQANRDRRNGRRRSAEKNYNLALAHNPRNHRALLGLSELYFDMGEYPKSVKNAQLAVRYAPKNARYLLQLGDSLYKVRRYLEARKAYEQAQSRGSRSAKQRLKSLRAKLGSH